MYKNNKKGFTLIEMMIVIAVVAVLVSIIIPVVGNSTLKANAATNAANLRSVSGQVTSGKLLGDFSINDATFTYFPENEVLTVMGGIPAPNAKECCAVLEDTPMWVQIQDDGTAYCTYEGYDVNYFAYIAEHGTEPEDYEMTDSNKLLVQTKEYAQKLDYLATNLNSTTKAILKNTLGVDIDQMAKDAGDLTMNVNGQFDEEQAGELIDDMEAVNEWLDTYDVCVCTEGKTNTIPIIGTQTAGKCGNSSCGHYHKAGTTCGTVIKK